MGGRNGPRVQTRSGPYGPRPVLSRREEARLTSDFRKGDVEAGRILALSVAPMVLSIVKKYRLPGRLAEEDVVQDCHLAVMKSIKSGGFRPSKGRLTTWTHRAVSWCILRSINASERFAERNHQLDHPDLVVDPSEPFNRDVDRKEAAKCVCRGLCRLSTVHRRVLMARIDGRKFGEIAADKRIFARGITAERVRQIYWDAVGVLRCCVLLTKAREVFINLG